MQVILYYPDQGDSEYAAVATRGKSMSYRLLIYVTKGEIFIKYYSKIPSRFKRVSFDTEKLNGKHREVFAPPSFISNKK